MTLAVSIAPQVGMQNDKKTWVFGPDVTIDETGMAKTDSRMHGLDTCTLGLSLPPTTPAGLNNLLVDQLELHNFFPAILVLGATALATHY